MIASWPLLKLCCEIMIHLSLLGWDDVFHQFLSSQSLHFPFSFSLFPHSLSFFPTLKRKDYNTIGVQRFFKKEFATYWNKTSIWLCRCSSNCLWCSTNLRNCSRSCRNACFLSISSPGGNNLFRKNCSASISAATSLERSRNLAECCFAKNILNDWLICMIKYVLNVPKKLTVQNTPSFFSQLFHALFSTIPSLLPPKLDFLALTSLLLIVWQKLQHLFL